jgi:uncharacterized membrane protein YqhA
MKQHIQKYRWIIASAFTGLVLLFSLFAFHLYFLQLILFFYLLVLLLDSTGEKGTSETILAMINSTHNILIFLILNY